MYVKGRPDSSKPVLFIAAAADIGGDSMKGWG
jgi:hypothetical protein